MKKIIATVLALCIAGIGNPAFASDSVEVAGEIAAADCPVGYQYSTGISVNVSTHVVTTICNAPPTDAELVAHQQDLDFWQAQRDAEAVATLESQTWNAAHTGQQKCFQWGPIVHANGVSTASGGVCANPVGGSITPFETAPATTDVHQEAPSIPDPQIEVPPITYNQDTFYAVLLSGQHGVEDCPEGFKGANGLVVDASTQIVTTQCWRPEAWRAYVAGGNVWAKYFLSGGNEGAGSGINSEPVINLPEIVAPVTSPEIPPASEDARESTQSIRPVTETTVQIAPDPNEEASVALNTFFSSLEKMPRNTSARFVTPPNLKLGKTIVTIRTPLVCKMRIGHIQKISNGVCKFQISIRDKTGFVWVSKRQIRFKS